MKSLGLVLAMVVGQSVVAAGPVELKPQPEVAKNVEAMPQVVGGVEPEPAAKINAAFKRLDAKVAVAARDCRKGAEALVHQPVEDAWDRGVEVTMRGPRYLSVMIDDSLTCGGPHPDVGTLPIVYDLNTGGTVNWLKLLPAGARSGVDDAADGNKIGAVVWPVLTAMERKGAEGDCREFFATEQALPFVLWLDAKAGAIEAMPSSVPHVLLPCLGPVVIPVAQARKMGGFNKEMLDALEAAHGLQK